MLSYILGVKVRKGPKLCILGIMPVGHAMNKINKEITAYSFLQARHNIVKFGK